MPAGQSQDFLKELWNLLECGVADAGTKVNPSADKHAQGREGFGEKVTGELGLHR